MIEKLAIVGMLLVLVSSFPQIIKLVRTKESKDISTLLYVYLNAGIFLLLIYSISIKDWFFIIHYVLNFLCTMTILVLSLKYSKKDNPHEHYGGDSY